MRIPDMRVTFSILLSVLLVASLAQPASAHTMPLTKRQMVHESEHIVVVVIENVQPRWNPQHTLIFTDYRMRVEQRLKGNSPDRIAFSLPGGTLDGETHETCLASPLEKGSRYLLFLGDLAELALTPVTGAGQGVFREIIAAGGKSYVSAGGSKALTDSAGRRIEFAAFVKSVRRLVMEVEAHPEPSDSAASGLEKGVQRLPVKSYDPAAIKAGASTGPESEPAADAPPPPWTNRTLESKAIASSFRFPEGKYVYQGRPPSPIVFNNFPRGFSFAPHDQYQMAYWNIYAKDLFRVRTNPTTTWSFGNGVFDLAGWPNNDQMSRQFGVGWRPNDLGVTFSRSQNGTIVEADIVLNPAFAWTVDDKVGTRPGRTASFRHVMLHELGHAWGLKHPWETQDVWWDSVMNYAPKEYHVARLLADDTTAARNAYPGISIRDGALSAYGTQDTLFDMNATYVPFYPSRSSLRAGESFTLINRMKLENTGTVRLVNPVVEVYLVPQRFSFSRAIFLTSLRYSLTAEPFSTHYLLSSAITVPRSTPAGTYYLGFFLRDVQDTYQGNNSAWSNNNTTIRVVR